MYYDDRNRTFNFVAGLALGAVIGASIALLAAPQRGKKTRSRLFKAIAGARGGAGGGGFDWGDLSSEVGSAIRAGRRRLKL